MSVKRECGVVMLPTEKATNALKGYLDGNLLFNYQEEYKTIEAEKGFTGYYHLYIISDDKIKNLDWFINMDGLWQMTNNIKPDHGHKVIATTDTSLKMITGIVGSGTGIPFPQPSDSFIRKFIKAYNSGNPIEDVMVEYEEVIVPDMIIEGADKFIEVLKVNSKNNTISISKIKDSWNRKEVSNIIYEVLGHFAVKHDIYIDGRDITKWIKENL